MLEDERAFPLKSAQINEFAKNAGFSKVELFADFERTPFTGQEDGLIVLLSA